MELHEIEIWIAVNNDGDFVVNVDCAEDALSDLHSTHTNEAARVYAMKVKVPLPKVIEVQATIPETDGPVTVTVA